MSGELTEQARAIAPSADPAFELVYEFDAKGAGRAYKRYLWRRVRRAILIASAISLACLVGIFAWEASVFLVLGAAYPAAYVVLWLTHLGQIDETYEALGGRKVRMLIDAGGLSSYSGNTFKRVQWLGVSKVVAVGDYFFIYYERDSVPSGSFPKAVLGEDALAFLRERTHVVD